MKLFWLRLLLLYRELDYKHALAFRTNLEKTIGLERHRATYTVDAAARAIKVARDAVQEEDARAAIRRAG